MLKTKVMYELYVKNLKHKATALALSNRNLEQQKEHVLKLLSNYKQYINQSYDKSYNDMIEFTSLLQYQNVKTINDMPLIDAYFKSLITINRKININKKHAEEQTEKIISYKLYKAIIQKCNDKIVDQIVFHNYYFYVNDIFGAIAIVQANHKRDQYDWGKSNKKRAKLIEQGLTPYLKEDAEKAAEEGREYNGVKWLVTYPKANYFFHWFKYLKGKQLNPILKDYKFIPARRRLPHLPSPVRKLQSVKEDPKRAAALYTRTINYNKDIIYETSK